MKAFRFSLEKALHWRRVQLEMEEKQFQRQAAGLAEMDRVRAELEAAAIRAEVQVRNRKPLAGLDLAALAGFRQYVHNEEQALAARRAECQDQLNQQQRIMMEARRRYRLLERLKERRLAAWRAAADRELDQLAAESHLAGIARRRREPLPYNGRHDA